MLTGKTVLIGITGGIAAYKICELIRMFKRANANVHVICTHNALNFVTKLTLQNLSQNEVCTEEFDVPDFKPEHISLADKADIIVIAPATANTISKIAHGICDNLLTSVVCAFKKPIILTPAMNCNMWQNPVIQNNIKILEKNNYKILYPETGFLACGYNGAGRLCSLDKIFQTTVDELHLSNKLKDKTIIVTAGGTIEDIDPVRYISNYSSGKMGTRIADEAYSQGSNVILITTKDVQKPYKTIKVKSAIDMQTAINAEFNNADCVIMAAAVADYRAKTIAQNKMKKTSADEITIELVKNPDILKGLCERKTNQIIVGFCAESEDLYENAKKKIGNKGCDFLVANDISRKDIGFSSDENEVVIINKNLDMKIIDKADKKIIAKKILEEIYG